LKVETCGSFFYFAIPGELRWGSLLYYYLRLEGIHVQEGFPCFLTTAHSDSDLERIVQAFDRSLTEMQASGFLSHLPDVVAGTAGRPATIPPTDHISPVPADPEPSESPLTEAQLEILLSTRLSKEAACSYNESFYLTLRGRLDAEALRASINGVIQRHQALRARFEFDPPRMRFASSVKLDIPTLDIEHLYGPEQEQRIHGLADADSRTPFDVAEGNLIRAMLIRRAADLHVLMITSHHIVCDGWSTNVILNELAAFYSARITGNPAELPERLHFGQYAIRQEQDAQSTRGTEVEAYWLKRVLATRFTAAASSGSEPPRG
jgi:hypothetical protein